MFPFSSVTCLTANIAILHARSVSPDGVPAVVPLGVHRQDRAYIQNTERTPCLPPVRCPALGGTLTPGSGHLSRRSCDQAGGSPTLRAGCCPRHRLTTRRYHPGIRKCSN